MSEAPTLPDLPEMFTRAMSILFQIIWMRGHGRIKSALFEASRHRVQRLQWRVRRLLLMWQAGTLPPPRPSRPSSGTPREARPRPPSVLPRTFGWLDRLLPEGKCAVVLDYVLRHRDFAAFLAAAPQAGRLLRPLCHLLGVHRLPPTLPTPPPPHFPTLGWRGSG